MNVACVRVRGMGAEKLLPAGRKPIWAMTTPSKVGRAAPPATARGTGYMYVRNPLLLLLHHHHPDHHDDHHYTLILR